MIGVLAAEAGSASATDGFTLDSDTTNGSWTTPVVTIGGAGGVSGVSLISQSKKVTASAAQTYNLTLSGAGQDTILAWVELTVPTPSTGDGKFFQLFP